MTTLVQPPPSPPAAPRRGRRWLIAGATAWGLLLAGAAVLSYHRDAPTVREQRTIGQAAPVIDQATGDLAAAVVGAPATLAISGRQLTIGCRLTSAWDGATLERTITVRTAESFAPELLDRVAQRLPARYAARVRHDEARGLHRLWADAGEFVAISGGVPSPGLISVVVRTGCRPPSPGFDPEQGERVVGSPHIESITTDLTNTGARDVEVTDLAVVSCPDGSASFVSVATTARGDLGTVRRGLPRQAPTDVVIDEPDQLGISRGTGSDHLRADGDRLTATSTRYCVR